MFVTIVVVVSGGYGWDDRFTLAILAQACIVLPSHPPYYFTFVTFATLLLCCLVVLLAILHGLWLSSQLSTLLGSAAFHAAVWRQLCRLPRVRARRRFAAGNAAAGSRLEATFVASA